MSVPKETEYFQDWLQNEVGDEWFGYERVDVRGNTYLIRTMDDEGDTVLTVWSRGQVRYRGGDYSQAVMTFERERKKA